MEEDQTSKINSGMLIILRLNDLWKDAHRHARAGKYGSWNDDLDRVWCELGGDVKPLTKKEEKDGVISADKEYEELTLEFAKACEGLKKPEGFDKLPPGARLLFAKQKQTLIKKEIFLRRLQNRQGKGTAYHDSSEDYMD